MASIIGPNETTVLKAKDNGNPVHSKHKIILIGDSHAQGCAERLIYQLENSYNVICYVRPNGHVGIITSTPKVEVQNLTNIDVLVLCAGSRNTGKMSPQKGSTISRIYIHTYIHVTELLDFGNVCVYICMYVLVINMSVKMQ
jgi:hypothetical protein